MSSYQWPPQASGGASGVSSFNGLTGAITLAAGTNISLVPVGNTITINNTGSGSGTVTTVSVVSANGFAGTVATATTTPAITISTSVTGVLKGNGTAISAATAGTDYVIPSGSITGTAGNITATSNSTITTLSALSLPLSQTTGTATVAQGGTGLATLTAGNVILGAGTSAVTFVSPATSGNVLTANGTTWVSQAASSGFANPMTTAGDLIYGGTGGTAMRLATGTGVLVGGTTPSYSTTPTLTGTNFTGISLTTAVSGTLPVANGGTGSATALTQYGVKYAASTTAEATTAAGTANYPLVANSAAAPTFQQLSLTAGVTGTLPVANGGTGSATALTQYGVIYASSTTAEATTAAGAVNTVLTGNGSANPTFSNPATGSYSQAYFGPGSSWTTSSTSFTDPTNSGGNTLTVRQHSGITLTAAASSICGITFTPANNTAVYLIWAQVAALNGTTANYAQLQMTDGTTVITSPGLIAQPGNNSADLVTIGGIYAPASASAVTVKLQLLASSGATTSSISGQSVTGSNTVEWTVLRVF